MNDNESEESNGQVKRGLKARHVSMIAWVVVLEPDYL